MEKVLLSRENDTSIITFNRPEKYNALDYDALVQLQNHLETIKNNDDSILILQGEGKAFSAGGDVSMIASLKDETKFRELMDVIVNITMALYDMEKIVISAINGSAAGLGLSIALNADYVIANKEAKIGMLFAGIGLIPDGGGHFFLEQRVGVTKAKHFIWNINQIEASKALEEGYIDMLVDDNAFSAAKEKRDLLLQAPLKAYIQSKNILHKNDRERLYNILQAEKKGQWLAANTKDHKEGVAAFIEKRPAKFRGE